MTDRQTGYPSVDKPWLKYFKPEDRGFEIPNINVYEYLVDFNKDNLSQIALEYFGTKVSYGKLISNIDRCAEAFEKLGIKQGDVVSFCTPSTPEIYYAFFALNKIGAIANLIDPRTNASRIGDFIFNSDSRVVIYIDISYGKIRHILEDRRIEKAIAVSVADSLKTVKKIGYVLKTRSVAGKCPEDGEKYISWKCFFEKGSAEKGESKIINTDNNKTDLAAGIIYTSGTTGVPKGAVISNKNMIAMVLQAKCFCLPWDKGDVFLGIMPPFIAYGLVIGFVMPLCRGMKVVIIPKFEVEKFDLYIDKIKPNHIMGVPAYVESLTRSRRLSQKELGFLKTVIVGGDKMNPEEEVIVNEFLQSHGADCRVIKGYGMTEMSSCAVIPVDSESNKIGSVGIPSMLNNIKVIDPETGREMGYNEVGEICLSGPVLIDGFWKNESETKRVFRMEDGIRWIHTGDRGYIDEDGVVFFNDRVKRIIIRSDGHNVWPSDSERIIEKNPDIENCCVVGLKDKTAGQGSVVSAFIVLKKEATDRKNKVIEDLKQELLKNLPTRDVPIQYYAIDHLPLTDVGKIDYRALENEYNG